MSRPAAIDDRIVPCVIGLAGGGPMIGDTTRVRCVVCAQNEKLGIRAGSDHNDCGIILKPECDCPEPAVREAFVKLGAEREWFARRGANGAQPANTKLSQTIPNGPAVGNFQALNKYVKTCNAQLAGTSDVARLALGYVERRFGLDRDHALELGLGVDTGAWKQKDRPLFLGSMNGRARLVIPLRDATGCLTYLQGRALDPEVPDHQRWRGPTGDGWGRWGAFRLDRDGPVLFTEGPTDALAAVGAGFGAVFVRGGFTADDAAVAAVVGREVVVPGDNDASGEGAARRNRDKLAAAGVAVRDCRVPGQCGDLAEWREAVGSSFGEVFKEAIEVAPEWEPTAASVPAPNGHEGTGRLALTKVDPSTFEAFEWLERGMVPAAALTLLAGIGGKGKSTLAAGYAAKATRGKLKGKYAGEPINVLWIGNEDGMHDVMGPRLQAAGADFSRFHFVTLDSKNIGDELNIVTDIEALRECIERVDAKLVVIDPVVEFLPAATDSHNDMSVRQALRPIRNLAKELKIAVIGLVHLNKGDTLDIATRITGSGAFRNSARSVLVVAEYPDDEEHGPGWRVVFQNKSNSGPESGRGRLYRVEGVEVTDGNGRPIVDSQGERATTGRIVWGAEVDLDPYNLPSRAREHGAPQTDKARAMLKAVLGAGPRLRSDVEDRAKADGIGWRTVEAAKVEEGVEDRQIPVKGLRGPGPSWWKLPDSEWSATFCVSPDCGPLGEPQTLMPQGDSPSANEWSASSAETGNEIADLSRDAGNSDIPGGQRAGDFALVAEEACARCGQWATTTVDSEPRCADHSDPLDDSEGGGSWTSRSA